MAEAVPEGEMEAVKPAPKRRRFLDAKDIVPVPVYSNKVNSSLQLRPMPAVITSYEEKDTSEDDSLWQGFSSKETSSRSAITLSDSEEDEAGCVETERQQNDIESQRCSSPSPPESPVLQQSRQATQKLMELDKNLRAVNSLFSPEPSKRTRTRSGKSRTSTTLEEEEDDEDLIIVTPDFRSDTAPYSSSVREIPLKVRCRTDIHKIPVLSSTPLSDVLTKLSVALNVPPPRLLLLREEVELPTNSTVGELGLGVADIIECAVMAEEERIDPSEGSSSSNISVRLQGKDKDSSQEFSLHRDAPLGTIFSQYLSKMPAGAQRKVRFHFDGSKVTHSQTPAQLSMEDGDIIEVWT